MGGGNIPKPGEISLAHRGVLFLDEFPEFGTRLSSWRARSLISRDVKTFNLLAQADVGIAMGAASTDVAIEAAHIALMRE